MILFFFIASLSTKCYYYLFIASTSLPVSAIQAHVGSSAQGDLEAEVGAARKAATDAVSDRTTLCVAVKSRETVMRTPSRSRVTNTA